MSAALDSLVEMGFPRNRAEKALAKTNNQGPAAAMDWLLAHSEDPDIDEPYEAPKGHRLTDASPETTAQASDSSATVTASSMKCEDCGKQLRDADAVQAHAIRTGHANFAESTEEIRPLTEEEKKAKLEELRQRMAERRAAKEIEEKQEKIDREKVRRRTGQEIAEARQKHEMLEAQRMAERKRREKLEEKQAREAIRAKIAQDKAERAAKAKAAASAPNPAPQPETAPQPVSQPAAKKEYTSCRIQIRLSNGSALTNTFSATDLFDTVLDFVRSNRTDGYGPFSLMTTFPRRVFGDDCRGKSLQDLGLVPSAVLVMTKG